MRRKGVRLEGKAKLADSPLGKAVSFSSGDDSFTVPREALPMDDGVNVGEGDFSVAAWIHPGQLRKSGIVSLGSSERTLGWYLETSDNKGTLRISQTAGQDSQANASVLSPRGTVKANAWQHIAVVVRRGRNETRMYVNGFLVARESDRDGAIRRHQSRSPIGAHSPELECLSGRIGGCPAVQPAARRS